MMDGAVMKLENISDEKFDEILSEGWKLMSVDHFHDGKLVYSFVRT